MDSDAVPEGLCGFTLSPGDPGEDVADEYEDGTDEWYAWGPGIATCIRDTWEDTGRCIWHAETDQKPSGELRATQSDTGENLASSHLVGVDIDDSISFADCRLIASNFTQATLGGADLTDANLIWADLTDANLTDSNLTDADLLRADLTDAELTDANLTDADLAAADLTDASLLGADLTDADFSWANLTDASLRDADLTDAYLYGADLTDASLRDAYLYGADLTDADLTDADLYGADLPGADLIDAELTDADLAAAALIDADLYGADLTDAFLGGADLLGANLENAVLSDVNLFGTTLTGSALYGANFSSVTVNRYTEFGGHYHDASTDGLIDRTEALLRRIWGAITPGSPLLSRLVQGDVDDESEDLRKAAWSYRQTANIFEEHGFEREARELNLHRKEIRRRLYLVDDENHRSRWRWLLATLSSYTIRHGESPWRVVGISLMTILGFGLAFPFFGGMKSQSAPDATLFQFDPIATGALDLPHAVDVLLANLYFSGVTFTTLGYGDIQPATPAVEFLATVESFLGALLMALLVFVLGRRTTW